MPVPEMIAVSGFLDRGANFTLRRCYSTRTVRRAPRPHDAYALELLDAADQVLVRTHPEVQPEESCTSKAVGRWRVTGYIGWRESAGTLRLTAEGLVLWQTAVLPAPTLRMQLGAEANARERPLELRLKLSPGTANAYVQLVYQWGEKQFQVLGYYRPAGALKVDLRAFPGGRRCRLVAHYSNGMRSASAVTKYFAVPELGPQLAIVTPGRATTLLPGQPLELVGQVVDRERPGGANPKEDLTWWVDDELVGRGELACVQQPKAGRRRVRLRYEPSGVEVVTAVLVTAWEQGMPVPAAYWSE